ncbi:MAG: TonB-dependent receptor domain-containing protein, partial [Pseudomonadales bacterium]
MNADFEIADRDWRADVSVTLSERNLASTTPSDTLTDNTDAAFAGLGGPDCNPLTGTRGSGNEGTGGCFYYNPFATSVFDPITNAKWNSADASVWAGGAAIGRPNITVADAARLLQNPVELIDFMTGQIQTQSETTQTVVDAVVAGDLFYTKHGPIGLAVGGQFRRDEIRVDNDKNLNDNNFKFVFGAQDWDGELTTLAAFVEVFIPLSSWAELTVAGRFETFDEIDTDTFDPKVTLLVRPFESLSLRASGGTSFRVGSQLQLFGQQTTLLNSTDPFSGTGGLAFRPTLTDGNADLDPEEATVFNIGLSWAPVDGLLEGLTLDLDYYDYDYDDIITREA